MVDAELDIRPGSVVGRLRLLRPLGEGGLAKVYLAEHELLGSQHAVKFLSVQGEKLAERLIREGQIQARLRHPHIVPVTDVVEVSGMVGLVMEFIEGPSLRELIDDNGAMPVPEALALFAQILDGVSAAHEAGVLHRDLKPGNVMLRPTSRGYCAMVTDFGIAKVQNPGEPNMTRTGMMMGTPGYMAPEQINDAAHVDLRADIFALGVVLYEMIAGRSPYEGGDLYAMIDRTMNGRYTPLQRLTGSCPRDISDVVDRCLRPEAIDRFSDCAALARALGVHHDAREPAVPVVIEQRALSRQGRSQGGSSSTWVDAGVVEPTGDGAISLAEAPARTAVPEPTLPKVGPTMVPADLGAEAPRQLGPDGPTPSPLRDGTPMLLAVVRSRAAARAEARPDRPLRRTAPSMVASYRKWREDRRMERLVADARAAGEEDARQGPQTHEYSRYSMLHRPDEDRGAYLRRRRPTVVSGSGDLLKRRMSWRTRAGLLAVVAGLGVAATLGGTGMWLREVSSQVTEAEIELRQQDTRFAAAVTRSVDLVDALVAEGAQVETLQGARTRLTDANSAADQSAAASALLVEMEAGYRSLPADPDAATARSAIGVRLEELRSDANARDRAEQERDARRGMPGQKLAVDLGLLAPSSVGASLPPAVLTTVANSR